MGGIDVQADDRFDDRVELAGNVLMVALPVTAAGLTLGFKDGQDAWAFGESAALSMCTTFALRFSIKKHVPMVRANHSRPDTLRFHSPLLSSCASVTDGSMAYQLPPSQHLWLTAGFRHNDIIRSTW
jgi:hypothetical protein